MFDAFFNNLRCSYTASEEELKGIDEGIADSEAGRVLVYDSVENLLQAIRKRRDNP